MTTIIRVSLAYDLSNMVQSENNELLMFSFPVKILDSRGETLAEGVASESKVETFQLSQNYKTVYVRLKWPSERTETRKVIISDSKTVDVVFKMERVSNNDWASWALPRLNTQTSIQNLDDLSIKDYLNVWMRLWSFKEGKWQTTSLEPTMQYKSNIARQIDLVLERGSFLLQIGGANFPWRFVGLPGSGACRVLLMLNDSKDPRADPLRIFITGFRTDAETLLEFLARDSLRAANTLVECNKLASELFQKKYSDPISAIAGAYFKLRVGDWDQIPIEWWSNLSRDFSYISDTSIIYCIRLLRAGLETEEKQELALQLFKMSLDNGWPIYEEGAQLLEEAGSLLRNIAKVEDIAYFSKVENLVSAKTWGGSTLSFYGWDPAKPSAILWVGKPTARRRKNLKQAEKLTEAINRIHSEHIENQSVVSSSGSRELSALSFVQEYAPKPRSRKKAVNKNISVSSQQSPDLVDYIANIESLLGKLVLPKDQLPSLENHLVIDSDYAMADLANLSQIDRKGAYVPTARKDLQDSNDQWMLLGEIGN
ncbi:hypothetical protein [Acinetobacter guillouiae]|uniref:hypothetical protein n=1 Tax=Acinetobacter guillouiae TaxID=106649 RepID=UPI003340C05A